MEKNEQLAAVAIATLILFNALFNTADCVFPIIFQVIQINRIVIYIDIIHVQEQSTEF